ncbi:MAG: peptidylprolyl isomerase [Sedimentisphaeraceae bacterium JB056]
MADNKKVALNTSKGKIVIELDFDNAPITAKNFADYVEEGFFNGTIFHRVINGFMIQGGGMTPDMKEKSNKAPIKLESDNGLKNARGTVAMARTMVPDSATSQFFINHKDNDFLNYAPGNPGYAVFGKVVEGMDIVDEIANVDTGRHGHHDDVPLETVEIESAAFVD